MQVRRAMQRLPLGPDESRSIAALEQRAALLRARAEALRARTVPRPQRSQYPALQQELARFMHSLGSVPRISALLEALQVSPCGDMLCPPVQFMVLDVLPQLHSYHQYCRTMFVCCSAPATTQRKHIDQSENFGLSWDVLGGYVLLYVGI